jgi:hypothetical protein
MGKGKDDKAMKKPDPRQPGVAPPASSTARPGVASSSQTPRPSANPSQARPKSGEDLRLASRKPTSLQLISNMTLSSDSCVFLSFILVANKMPIIIVPAAVTSMITMYNVRQLLEGQE